VKSKIKLPKVADSIDEVIVSTIRVSVGDRIKIGDIVLLVETDKAQVEVPSPIAGVVTEILVAIDEEIATGAFVVVVDSE
jgi:pyruvate/2-oxoglutarate dehydrogenase complex dihydrolipoamide acyltransferase (E2) component